MKTYEYIKDIIEEITNYLDTPQSDIEGIIKQSKIPLAEFPALFTSEEEQYIKEAMNKI